MKVKIVNPSPQYVNLFTDLGYTPVENIEDADMLCFTGGADIDPSFYNHKRYKNTFVDSERDDEDFDMYQEGRFRNLPMIGICRGAQFLHAMNGGQLYQDVSGHTKKHMVELLFDNFSTIEVTSTHHQMMIKPDFGSQDDPPYPQNTCEVLAWCPNESVVMKCVNGNVFVRGGVYDTLEVAWWTATKCLCFQPHPEHPGEESTKQLFKLVLKKTGLNCW